MERDSDVRQRKRDSYLRVSQDEREDVGRTAPSRSPTPVAVRDGFSRFVWRSLPDPNSPALHAPRTAQLRAGSTAEVEAEPLWQSSCPRLAAIPPEPNRTHQVVRTE